MPYELIIRSATRKDGKLYVVYDDGTGHVIELTELKNLATQEPDVDWLIAQALRKWMATDPNFTNVTSVANKKLTVTLTVGPA